LWREGGTTTVGGNFANNYCAQNGCGTVFKIDATGYHTVLHTFSGPDGATPLEGLVRDAAGNLYGTTGAGGSSGCDVGCGVIYKIDPAGNETLVHEFLGYTADGAGPNSNLIIDQSGNLYGTASAGGAFGSGIIYELSSTGVYTILHSFNGKSGGANPQTGVIRDGKGNLYGTTAFGGIGPDTNEDWGYGTVFQYASGLGPIVETVPVAGKAGQKVLILGNNLTGTTGVTFNGIHAASFTVDSDTYMTAVVPQGATTGPVEVTSSAGTLKSNVNFRILQ